MGVDDWIARKQFQGNRATLEDMVSELVSHKVAGLAELASKDYVEFEAQMAPRITEDYAILTEDQVAELYEIEIGTPAPGWPSTGDA